MTVDGDVHHGDPRSPPEGAGQAEERPGRCHGDVEPRVPARPCSDLDIEIVATQVGDRYVLEEMRRSRAVLGGEQSGHIILEDRATGDGLRSAIRLAEVMVATGAPLSELRKVMTELPPGAPEHHGAEQGAARPRDPDLGRACRKPERALARRWAGSWCGPRAPSRWCGYGRGSDDQHAADACSLARIVERRLLSSELG